MLGFILCTSPDIDTVQPSFKLANNLVRNILAYYSVIWIPPRNCACPAPVKVQQNFSQLKLPNAFFDICSPLKFSTSLIDCYGSTDITYGMTSYRTQKWKIFGLPITELELHPRFPSFCRYHNALQLDPINFSSYHNFDRRLNFLLSPLFSSIFN